MASKIPEGRVRVEPTITLGTTKESSTQSTDSVQNKSEQHPTVVLNQKAAPTRPGVDQSRRPPPVVKSGIPAGVFVSVTALLLVVIAGGGWFFYQQIMSMKQELDSSKDALNMSTSQLGTLESKLSDTDQALNKTGDKTSQKLAFLDSEVRKLWEVANKRNKQAIEANAASLRELNNSLSQAKRETEALKKQLSDAIANSQAQVKNIQSMSDSANELKAQTSVQDIKVAALQESVNKLVKLSGLVEKVNANTQSIQSIDAYRRQTNTSIEQINRDIRILFQRADSSKGAAQP